MSLTINHNLMASNTARNLSTHYGSLAVSTRRLSSGLRIGTAADDAAGLAVREIMRADIASLGQGVRNANDAISMIQVADGALQVIDEKLIRMKELATQAATGTYSSTQRLIIDSEFQAMKAEIDRIAHSTEFNGIKLLERNSDPVIEIIEQINISGFGQDPLQNRMSYGLVEIDGELYAAGRGTEVWNYNSGTSWSNIAPSAGSGIVVIDKWENNLVVSKNTPGGMTVYSYNGTSWSQINNPGFGNPNNFGTDAFATVNGELYVAAHNNSSGVEIYKYEGGTTWSQINVDGFGDSLNTNAYMTSYNGNLYASTWNSTGTEVYRYDGSNTWTQVAPKGLDKTSTALHFAEINDTLYGSAASPAGAVVFEYQGESSWLQVNEDGFGEGITGATQLVSFNNELYLGGGGQAADDVGTVYKYAGGTSWERILDDGLGNPNNRQITLWSYGNILYATTFNPTDGVEVYRYLQSQNDPMIVHFGTKNNENIDNYKINLMDARIGTTGLNIANLTVETQDSASSALPRLTEAIIYKDKIRATLGATQNRLENTITNLEIQAENLQAAESRISDADMATEMTEFVKSQILTQSATAMLAQANSLPEMALQLIQGQR